jgi:long-subunit fatty acid transport protein
VTGTDLPLGAFNSGYDYPNVADDFNSFAFGLKHDITDRFSLAFTGQEDFGSDITYDGDPRRTNLGGTSAIADTYALALIGRFAVTENVSFHAGVRRDTADGTISLGGLAYGSASGYKVELGEDVGYGYLIGGAYEIPDIAFRLAITYNSKIRHDFKTTETLNGRGLGASNPTDVDTPQSVNIDFQTGVAADTLVFASMRWAEWSEFKIAPERFEALTGSGLVSLDDSTTWTVGVGRRFTESFAARASFIYEDGGSDDLVSPLAPTNGLMGVALGASYRTGPVELSGGVRYTWLGDAKPETGTPDVARANFSDNDAVSVGLKLGYYF